MATLEIIPHVNTAKNIPEEVQIHEPNSDEKYSDHQTIAYPVNSPSSPHKAPSASLHLKPPDISSQATSLPNNGLEEIETPPLFLDRYEVIKILGEGSYGKVKLAFDTLLQKKVLNFFFLFLFVTIIQRLH